MGLQLSHINSLACAERTDYALSAEGVLTLRFGGLTCRFQRPRPKSDVWSLIFPLSLVPYCLYTELRSGVDVLEAEGRWHK